MYGYIYKTICTENNKIYVGQKKSSKFLENKYLGSGKILKHKIDTIGADKFSVELIDTAETKQELDEKEIYWINKLNSRNPLIGYNVAEGGGGGAHFLGHKHSDETKLHMSNSRMGNNNGNYGNHWKQSDELRALHSKLSSGEGNGMYGKKHSEESKDKNRNSHIGKKAISNLNSNTVKMVYPDDVEKYLSQGWVLGNIHITSHLHTDESKEKISKALKGKPKTELHRKHLSESRLNKNNKL